MAMRAVSSLAIAAFLLLAGGPVEAQKSSGAAVCSGGWRGTVKYVRSQENSSTKTEDRLSGKGTQTTDWSMTYDYAAQIAVRPSPDAGYSLGRANITLASTSTETVNANDRHVCPHEKTARAMSGTTVSKSTTSANAAGVEAGVDVTEGGDGSYTVGVILPDVPGKVSGSTSSSYSGQCTPRKGTNQTIADSPYTVDGVRFASSGADRISPRDPNRITGSFSSGSFGVVETISWDLSRCGGDLRLIDLKFADMKFPTWGAWQEIEENRGTVDGNMVRLTAVVANDGAEEETATVTFRDTYKGDKWDGARPDGLLEQLSVTIPSGEQREVSFEWDSSGFAWFDDGRPRLVQRIKAELEDDGKKVDDLTRNLKVTPKPVVLVHGLWSNWQAWESWQNILTTTHSYDWKAYPVGEKPQFGRMNTGDAPGNLGPTNTIAQNADELSRYIKYAQRERNAWHVDIVAHSMGGLISRRYIHAAMPVMPDGKPLVTHLAMLGTPNMGSRCADLISVPLETAGEPMEALRELRPSVVAKFNAAHGERKGTEFSILAGNPIPIVCYMFDRNDGVVTVPSATWTIGDRAESSKIHTSLTDVESFSSFVRPRLAIGPGKQPGSGGLAAYAPAPAGSSPFAGPYGVRLLFIGEEDESAQAAPDFAKLVTIAPGESIEVAVPVRDARNLGLTFVADPAVSAILADPSGTVAATNLSDTAEAAQIFRSLLIERPVSAGVWTLTLRNGGETERSVALSTWSQPH